MASKKPSLSELPHVHVDSERRQLQAANSSWQGDNIHLQTWSMQSVHQDPSSGCIRLDRYVLSSYHVVGVLRLDEGRKEVDPLLDCLVVALGLAGLVQEIPGKDGGVLLVQQAVVGVAPAGRALLS